MALHGVDVLLVAGVALLALTLGARLLSGLRVACLSRLEQAVMATGLGLGCIAYLVLALGLLGWLKVGVVATSVAALSLSQARGIAVWLRIGWQWLRQQRNVQQPLSERALTVYLVVTFLVLLLATLCPPASNDWDGLSYHLAAPKNFIRHGRIFYVGFDHHSNFPFTIEMLYTLALLLRGSTMDATGGAVAAKLFHTLFALLGTLTIYAFGRRHLSRTAGLIGAVVYLSIPIVAGEAVTAYADLGLAAFALLAFYAFWNGTASITNDQCPGNPQSAIRNPQSAILTGIFTGLAMGTKYSGLLILGWLGLLMLARLVQQRISSSALRPSPFAFVVVALLTASPWYVKNLVYTGNPVHPFFYRVFGGRNWSASIDEGYRGHQREFGMGRSVVDFVLVPWRLTMWPWNYDVEWFKRPPPLQKGFEVQPLPTSALGPALLMFVVPLLFWRGHPKVIVYLLVTSFFFLLCWFFVLAQYNRYLFPILPLLSLCAGYAVVHYAQRNLPLRLASGAALASCCVFGFLLIVMAQRNEIAVGLGRMSERDYLSRFPLYAVCEFANKNIPLSARIVTYGEPRGFYLDRDYLWGDEGHHTLIRPSPFALRPLLSEYRRLKVTHVLFSTTQIGENSPYRRLFTEGVQQRALTPLWDERGYVLLEINEDNG